LTNANKSSKTVCRKSGDSRDDFETQQILGVDNLSVSLRSRQNRKSDRFAAIFWRKIKNNARFFNGQQTPSKEKTENTWNTLGTETGAQPITHSQETIQSPSKFPWDNRYRNFDIDTAGKRF